MKTLAYVNGEISSGKEAKISVFDRGFLFGDAVYETGRGYEYCCLYLEEHFKRLRHSAKKLGLPIPWSDEYLKKELYRTAKSLGLPHFYFRIIVSRGPIEIVSLGDLGSGQSSLVILVSELSKELDEVRRRGVNLLTSKVQRNPVQSQDPNIKTSNYLNSLLALQEVKARGAEDAVLCNREGEVAEGTTFAVFGVTPSKDLITPSLEVGILDSITRRHILSLSTIPVREGRFKVEAFMSCGEVFVASSVREIVPIKSWDGKNFPVPGPETAKLAAALKKFLENYVATHEKIELWQGM